MLMSPCIVIRLTEYPKDIYTGIYDSAWTDYDTARDYLEKELRASQLHFIEDTNLFEDSFHEVYKLIELNVMTEEDITDSDFEASDEEVL